MFRSYGIRLMGFEVSFDKARCEARCGASGEQRNAADEPSMPTEGRVLSGQMIPYDRNML